MLTKKEYDILKLKYQLPDFEELDKYFSISEIENTANLVREIRQKIQEKLEFIAKILADLFNPEQNFAAMYELKILDEIKKKKYFVLFKKIMALLRESEKLSLKNDEKMTIAFIKDFFKEYKKIVEEIESVLGEMVALWKSPDSDKDTKEYVG